MSKPQWEVLVGDAGLLDFLARDEHAAADPHPLQEVLETIIEDELTDEEKQVFYLRFGEQLSFRELAERMGYDSHMTFQVKVARIIDKVRKALENGGYV